MLLDRIEARWIEAFKAVFERCGVASGEDVVDVQAKEAEEVEPNEPMDELETLRRSQESLRSTLSFDDDGAPSSESSR